jgi:hypothetical protein
MIFTGGGLNYKKLFWRFWVPHQFEKNKHKFSVYFYWRGEFLGFL